MSRPVPKLDLSITATALKPRSGTRPLSARVPSTPATPVSPRKSVTPRDVPVARDFGRPPTSPRKAASPTKRSSPRSPTKATSPVTRKTSPRPSTKQKSPRAFAKEASSRRSPRRSSEPALSHRPPMHNSPVSARKSPTKRSPVAVKADYEKYILPTDDPVYQSAAREILSASFMLVATGAGFSADSGLAVYRDIADIPVYRNQNLSYHDLCHPAMLSENPGLFYGFWGDCWNTYKKTREHDGYGILKRWRSKLFSNKSKFAAQLQQEQVRLLEKSQHSVLGRMSKEGYLDNDCDPDGQEDEQLDGLAAETRKLVVEVMRNAQHKAVEASAELFKPDIGQLPGPFMSYTSNVDGHWRRQFGAEEVYEIHGSVDEWQCSRPCTPRRWKTPDNFLFEVDRDTMEAPLKPTLLPDLISASAPLTDEIIAAHFASNRPTCPFCGHPARPHVLMFGDLSWITGDDDGQRYIRWECSVENILRDHSDAKMVLLELGCGTTVPSVRLEMQQVLNDIRAFHGSCTLIRVNPDYPDNEDAPEHSIGIRAKALITLRKIDAWIQKLQAASAK